jgi:hypothetical protein
MDVFMITLIKFMHLMGQLFKFFPKTEFLQALKKTEAEGHSQGFACWGQLRVMLFG